MSTKLRPGETIQGTEAQGIVMGKNGAPVGIIHNGRIKRLGGRAADNKETVNQRFIGVTDKSAMLVQVVKTTTTKGVESFDVQTSKLFAITDKHREEGKEYEVAHEEGGVEWAYGRGGFVQSAEETRALVSAYQSALTHVE